MGSVGAVRDFLSAHCGIPRAEVAHYVSVVAGPDGDVRAIETCCDGTAEAAGMLREAMEALNGDFPLDPASPAVIVGREDLRRILDRSGAIPADVLSRLRAALGEEAGDGQ